jgi:hypothetical protein
MADKDMSGYYQMPVKKIPAISPSRP